MLCVYVCYEVDTRSHLGNLQKASLCMVLDRGYIEIKHL